LGYTKEEIYSDEIVITHPDDFDTNRQIRESLENPDVPSLSVEKRYIHKSGRTIYGLLSVAPFRDKRGKIVRLIAQIIDLSERKELENRIRSLAYTDTTTKLPNRDAVFAHLNEVLENIGQHQNPAFVYLDLNRFKVINDTFGHQTGDMLLSEIGTKLRQVIPQHIYVGRIGGDEFGLVLNDSADVDIKALAGNICQAMRTPLRVNNLELPVDLSIGAAIYPKGGLTADELITNADIAMYHAKRHHVDFRYYTQSINEYSEKLFLQESKLRQAISQKDFYLDFERAYQLSDQSLSFCEGLLRWKQDGEIVAPHHFVPIAESTGLIRKLDSITLQLVSQIDHNPDIPATAINLSRLSLLDSAIVDEISDHLATNQLDPGRLIVEVTETVAVSDTDQINRTLTSIKKLGLRIALDDFGTGFTSFSMLRELPLDMLKLDKSLTQGIGVNAVDEHIILATIKIGHELGLTIVAEGVETESQSTWLVAHDCDIAQGWYVEGQTPKPGFNA
jgi:diguanylate cyclase (GGDEF)-like protein/PAS domain S-box-containing protein